MSTERSGYMAYLLRLEQVQNGEETHWRASLQDVRTSQRHNLASMEDLFEFLRARTEHRPDLTAEEKG